MCDQSLKNVLELVSPSPGWRETGRFCATYRHRPEPPTQHSAGADPLAQWSSIAPETHTHTHTPTNHSTRTSHITGSFYSWMLHSQDPQSQGGTGLLQSGTTAHIDLRADSDWG